MLTHSTAPSPGFWTPATEIHRTTHTLEFKEHPQPRISSGPHCSPVSKVAASVSVFHGCPGIQGSEKTRKLHNDLELLQKQTAFAESKIQHPLHPLLFHLHLNITAQMLGKSWELLGQTEQSGAGEGLLRQQPVGDSVWGSCHLAGVTLLLSAVDVGQRSTCLKMAFHALCSSPAQPSFTHLTIQFS